MILMALLLFFTFFAAAAYATVVLIQIGGWLNVLAALILIGSCVSSMAVIFMGIGSALSKNTIKKGDPGNEGICS